MQLLIFLIGLIVIIGVLGTGEKKFPTSVQEELFVKDSGEMNLARTLRDARHIDKISKKKAGKKVRRKTLKRKQKKQNLKTRRKTKGGNRKRNRNSLKKGQKIKKILKTIRKGNMKGIKKSKKQGSSKKKIKKNRQETCGTEIDNLCISNAIEAMEFEKKQIKNFIKQKNRIEKQSELAGNKYNKKAGFAKAATMMLSALGNDTSSPVCGDGGNSSSEEILNKAVSNYETLNGCNESIKNACTVDKTILNETTTAYLGNCLQSFNDIKNASKQCQDKDTDLKEACDCWEKVTQAIDAEKKNCLAKPIEIAVKKEKDNCLKAFIICKKAEDAVVGLIHTCIKGEVKTMTADGRLE